jgi:hypothetical protein
MSRIAHYLNETYSLFTEQPGKITPTEENTQDNKEYLMGEIPPHFIDCNIV